MPQRDENPRDRWRAAWVILLLMVTVPIPLRAGTPSVAASRSQEAFEEGEQAWGRGDLDRAAEAWAAAAAGFRTSGEERSLAVALERLAEAQRGLGRYDDMVASLREAAAVAEAVADPGLRAGILGTLGVALLETDAHAEGAGMLERAAGIARGAGLFALEGAILNNLANDRAAAGENAAAAPLYDRAIAAARAAGDRGLEARAAANAARAALDAGEPARAAALLPAAHEAASSLPDSPDRTTLLTNLARSDARLAALEPGSRRELLLRAHAAFRESAETAFRIGDLRSESYAWGYMGSLYEDQERVEEALELTRRALFAAQEADAPDALYLWQWQLGRLLRARGDVNGALKAYRVAVTTLETIRPELSRGPSGSSRFRENVGPVYFELVDLLLRNTDGADPAERARVLGDTRLVIESLKKAELRDYFRDECVDALQQKTRSLDETAGDAMVIYPVLLQDRLELLVTLHGAGIERFTVPVGREALTAEVRRFRHLLEKRTTREYLEPARTLHRWLIEPLAPVLAGRTVSALVFVPDGALRTIPMTALWDGEHFLVERYAVAVAPGLDLIDPRPLDRESLNLLAGGLSEGRAGFAPLRHVPEELEAVSDLFGGRVLLDRDFTLDGIRTSLADQQVTVLHIASHGEFAGNADESYVLAWDDRLTMERLGDDVGLLRFRDRPLELLTLSACETAEGDDRAALGLAGIAIRAGARSAVGTLWKVNDVATARLVVDFYRELRDPARSRAEALARAQRHMLEDPRYRHPGYWSAFLLISNWL